MKKFVTLLTIVIICLTCFSVNVVASTIVDNEDVTAPVVSQISMNVSDAIVSYGDDLYFSVKVTDESEIDHVWLYFEHTGLSAGTSNEKYSDVDLYSYDADAGVALVKLTVSDCMPSGEWRLYLVSTEDVYGNHRGYNAHSGVAGFNDIRFTIVSNTDDMSAPVISSISLDNETTIVGKDESLYFSVKITDESELDHVWLYFEHTGLSAGTSNEKYSDVDLYYMMLIQVLHRLN